MKRNQLLVLIFGFALTAMVGCGVEPIGSSANSPLLQPSTAFANAGALADYEGALENIYAQVNPSVVAIEVVQSRPAPGNSIGPGLGSQPPGLHGIGSGFVWDAVGNIVTNNHVVSGADQISVAFTDGTIVPGKVVGADPDSDLAVVQVQAPLLLLHPVQLADSTKVKVGQLAIAIGSPFGEANTMTIGNISALGRSLPTDISAHQGTVYTIPDVIQTDAPINPGNSGGVLLNSQGQVIGVTSALESQDGTSSGIGFAIPSVIVQQVVPALIATGHYTHTFLGVSGTTLTPSVAKAMGLKDDQRGAYLVDVTANSPAAKAGLRGSTQQISVGGESVPIGGDVIIAIEGQPVRNFGDLITYLARSTQVNQTVTFTLIRDGKEQSVPVVIGARPSS